MCLIFLALDYHPRYKLIVAANRDEFYARKTEPAHFWSDHPEILAGRDLEAGGTWMGVSKRGRISLVTNYRDPAHISASAPSRGKLVSDFLRDETEAATYMDEVSRNAKSYNGFNLIAGTGDGLQYLSNYRDGVDVIKPGFYGLSNHLLETPWPKVLRGKEKIGRILQDDIVDADVLLNTMQDEAIAPDEQLPETGIDLLRERALSAMFIKSPGYGTRCSTVVLIDRNNNLTFTERVYDVEKFSYITNRFAFSY